MAKGHKLLFEEVRNEFAINKCKLLEDSYINNVSPMRFICHCGNESFISYANFRKKKCCKKCGWEKKRKSERKSIKEVQQKEKMEIRSDSGSIPVVSRGA